MTAMSKTLQSLLVAVDFGDVSARAVTLEHAQNLVAPCRGEVIDCRHHDLIEPALDRTRANLLVVPAAQPPTSTWLSNYGEPR